MKFDSIMAAGIRLITAGLITLILLCGMYFVWGISWLTIVGALMMGLILFAQLIVRGDSFLLKHPKGRENKNDFSRWIFFAIVILLDFALLFVCLSARTDTSLVSPWQRLPLLVFFAYGVASMFFCLISSDDCSQGILPLLMLHAAVTWGLSSVMFASGFGFDPFVHQAAETYILRHGFIAPRSLLYLGQYVSVVSVAKLTRLSIVFVDTWLVPVLSIFFLPVCWMIGLRAWPKTDDRSLSTRMPLIGMMALFFVPIMPFTFTVPFNLDVVLMLVVLCFLPFAEDRAVRLMLICLAIASMCIHPLLGIPLVCMIVIRCWWPKSQDQWMGFVLAAGIPLSLFLAFFLYAKQTGGMVLPLNMGALSDGWGMLTSNPYRQNVAWWLRAYDGWIELWPWVCSACGLFGLIHVRGLRDRSAQTLIGGFFGCLASAVVLASLLRFSNIVAAEQFEFAYRLWHAAPLVLLPGVALASQWVSDRYRPSLSVICFFAAAVGLVSTGVWYATYPMVDAAAPLVLSSVSHDDLVTVDQIEKDAQGKTYAVFSPQMLSAAALRRFGFERSLSTPIGSCYFYAIPTGGEMYKLYVQLFSIQSTSSTLQAMFDFTRVSSVFVVVPVDWSSSLLNDRLHERASSIFSAQNGMTVYRFEETVNK